MENEIFEIELTVTHASKVQENLQLADSPNSGHLQITDKKLKSGINYYKLLMEKPPNSGH